MSATTVMITSSTVDLDHAEVAGPDVPMLLGDLERVGDLLARLEWSDPRWQVVGPMVAAAAAQVRRAVERGSERAVERGSERAVERGSEREVERGSEREVERGSEREVERGSEREVERGSERDVERGSERSGGHRAPLGASVEIPPIVHQRDLAVSSRRLFARGATIVDTTAANDVHEQCARITVALA